MTFTCRWSLHSLSSYFW